MAADKVKETVEKQNWECWNLSQEQIIVPSGYNF